jgi:signal transduction protein with GAF and PtsI domain
MPSGQRLIEHFANLEHDVAGSETLMAMIVCSIYEITLAMYPREKVVGVVSNYSNWQ